jgi:hypothetical protein
MTDKYIINDVDEFTNYVRRLVFKEFGKNEDELSFMIEDLNAEEIVEMNKVLSQQECIVIVKNIASIKDNDYTDSTSYIIDENIFMKIIEEMNNRLVSNILTELTKRGLVESAYDSEINDFIFWVKSDDKEKE